MSLDFSFLCNSTLTGEAVKGFACLWPASDEVTYFSWMLSSTLVTLEISLFSFLVSVILGLIVGVFRTLNSHPTCLFIGFLWVRVFRNIPLIIQIFLWYHVFPVFFPALNNYSSIKIIIFSLGFFSSARVAEVIRSGINSISKGQALAAKALGLGVVKTYLFILIPQAIRIVTPPLVTESINIVKNSSVAFIISITELTFFARQVQEETSRGLEIYFLVTLIYVLIALFINLLSNFLEKKFSIPSLSIRKGT